MSGKTKTVTLKGFPNYSITKTGAIEGPGGRNQGRRLLTPKENYRGYLRVVLRKEGQSFNRFVHVLVLETFNGPRPAGHQAAHLNGKPDDNRIENLAWVTPKENNSHKKLHGTHQRGTLAGNVKLTEKEVRDIRRLYFKGVAPALARKFGVSVTCIRSIVIGKTWSHLI